MNKLYTARPCLFQQSVASTSFFLPFIFLFSLFFAPQVSRSQILSWNLNGAAGNEVSIAATGKDASLNSSSVTRGPGVTATALANAFSGSGWNVTSESDAVTNNKYFQFTVNAASGFQVSLSTLDVFFRRSGTGPTNFQWKYSLDGFATTSVNIGSGFTYSLTTSNGDAQTQIVLSSIAALQNVASSTTITIRLYGWNASGAAGTFALGRPTGTTSSLTIGGTVTSSVPVPTINTSTASLINFTTTEGSASASKNLTVSGANLTDNISISAADPYEISLDDITFSSSLALTQSAGAVGNTTVYTRIKASASAGAANGSLSLTSTGATTKNVTLTGTVNSAITVDPPQTFNATAISSSEIDLSATGNAGNDNIVVAFNSTNTFGVPSGVLVAGNTISGGGTVLYSGPSAGFTFAHTGRNAATTYFYKAWSVNGSTIYSTTGLTASATTNAPPAANVVINQVYGGGGNTGAIYKNDFIELYNNENTAVNLAGWSVQYTGATGNSNWTVTPLTGTVPPHSFFLIQEAAGANGTLNLPAPDVTGTIAMGATAGKVILCNTTVAQSGDNPAGVLIMDKVGYGPTATGFEVAPTAATENTTSAQRITDGVDNNNNATDFKTGDPIPRNKTYTITPPTVIALRPPNGTAGVPYNIYPGITFDKPIQKGTGNITIFENGVAGAPISVASSGIVITNSLTVSINVLLSGNKSYYIQIDPGAFTDVYGNVFAGISNSTTWAFTTYNSTVPVNVPVTFDFQNCTGSGLLPNGFTQYSITGNQVWDCTPFGRDPGAPAGTAAFPSGIQMNGFDNALGNIVNNDWLISPALDLTGTTFPLLSFYSRTRFNGDPLQLKISTDYTGTGDPSLATWTDLNGRFPAQTSDTWTLSSNINLSNFKQTHVYIAFVYTSTNDDGARWTLDDINIINSATPPPPFLTSSTTDIGFLYTASASSSVKPFTVLGNDLTGGGGISLSVTGSSFTLSKDNTTFASSINFTEAEANNISKTVYVKFAPALNDQNYADSISIATAGTGIIKVYLKGTSIDPAKTLEVVNWNMEWFGTPDPTLGPPNKTLQRQNAQTILQNTGADLYALVEVVDTAGLGSIVRTSMPGYSYVICNYGSHGNPFESAPSPMNELQKEAFIYKTSVFSNIDTTALLSLGVNTAADLSNPDYGFWSSGRYPYMFTADVTLGATTKRIRFIAVHAKANTSPTVSAYNRRKSGADDLHNYLNANFPLDNIVILGDFNDDLDSTITDGISPRVTSYSSFTNDAGNFYSPTLNGLSLTGKKSTVKYSDVIDHVLVSNEMQPFYMNGSVSVLTDVTSLVPSYGTTTSDHYPVFSRFAFDPSVLPIKVTEFTAVKQSNAVRLSWKTSEEINSKEFVVERSADGASFSAIGTVTAKGTASVYLFIDDAPLTGNNFYRLKLVDKDGKAEYSKVIKINFSKQLAVRIAPNPAVNFINVAVENSSSAVTLEIVDLNGKLVRKQQITPASQYTPVIITGLAKGLYTVKVIGSAEVATVKLVVQ